LGEEVTIDDLTVAAAEAARIGTATSVEDASDMTWFTVSVLVALKLDESSGGPIAVYENMYLVEASDSAEARAKAQRLGTAEATVKNSLTIDGKPAHSEFVGVRKIIEVRNPHPLDPSSDRPTDGTEVTYSLYEVSGEHALTQLADGQEVDLRYVE
jgi:hypothetical protein